MISCEFKNYCSKKWEMLEPSPAAPAIRYCDHCLRNVFLTNSSAETALFTALGQCVAISPTHEMMEKIGWVGEGEFDWMDEAGKQVAVDIRCSPAPTEIQAKGFDVLFEHHSKYKQMQSKFMSGDFVRIGTFDEKEAAVLVEKLRHWEIDATLSEE